MWPQGGRDMLPEKFWEKVAKGGPAECGMWTGSTNGRYGKFSLKTRMVFAHRRAWEIENGRIPAGMEICHRCDNPLCCNPAHLFAGTRGENVKDMVAKGRAPLPATKLSDPVTRAAIIEARGAGMTYREIAERFGVSGATAWRLVNEKSWTTSTAATRVIKANNLGIS
jgi:hypothetical protein